MKTLVFVCVLAALGAAVQSARIRREDKYTDKYDNINLAQILENDRLLKGYYDCVMEDIKCTTDAKELQKTIPDALTNECAKCTDKQKEGADIVIKFLIEKKPEYFKEIEKKYDPEGTYRTKYADHLKRITSSS